MSNKLFILSTREGVIVTRNRMVPDQIVYYNGLLLNDMNKYLHLAHWLNRNREDWSDGYSYAEVGINNFKVENEQDREILDSLLALIDENWDGDGRVFRDTKWNYDALYSLVPEDLRSDFMICRENTNDE